MKVLRIVLGIALLLALLVLPCAGYHRWLHDACENAGGKIGSSHGGYLCLTPDGRVIDP